jgi:hypothetical protein
MYVSICIIGIITSYKTGNSASLDKHGSIKMHSNKGLVGKGYGNGLMLMKLFEIKLGEGDRRLPKIKNF